jgi:hypothetical protein
MVPETRCLFLMSAHPDPAADTDNRLHQGHEFFGPPNASWSLYIFSRAF